LMVESLIPGENCVNCGPSFEFVPTSLSRDGAELARNSCTTAA
jgi:hypothetical protein